jgi:hypothetical protein
MHGTGMDAAFDLQPGRSHATITVVPILATIRACIAKTACEDSTSPSYVLASGGRRAAAAANAALPTTVETSELVVVTVAASPTAAGNTSAAVSEPSRCLAGINR